MARRWRDLPLCELGEAQVSVSLGRASVTNTRGCRFDDAVKVCHSAAAHRVASGPSAGSAARMVLPHRSDSIRRVYGYVPSIVHAWWLSREHGARVE
jgi:hypothetical protein